MTQNEMLQRIEELKVLPVVVINRIEDVEPMLSALESGGLPAAEITLRTPCAPDAIRLACERFPNMLIGAGTVINGETCRTAINSGAEFVVSPGFSAEVAKICRENGVLYIPGCVTPTEIMSALECGIETVKFFPCTNYGGLSTIKAISAAFPYVRFMPTGGINLDNIAEYLNFNKIIACGGSWMMKGTFEEIEGKAREAVEKINEWKKENNK